MRDDCNSDAEQADDDDSDTSEVLIESEPNIQTFTTPEKKLNLV